MESKPAENAPQQQQQQQPLSARKPEQPTSARVAPTSGKTTQRLKPPSIVVCENKNIVGNIKFGHGCVVHMNCTINASGGDIVFGDYCIVEEYCKIINQPRQDKEGRPVKKTMRIGSYNLFEVGTTIDSSDIGDLNEFGVRSQVGPGCLVGSYCSVNPMVQVPRGSKLHSGSVYVEPGNIRRDLHPREDERKTQIKEISAALAHVIPKFTKLRMDPNTPQQPQAQPSGATSARGQPVSGNMSARGQPVSGNVSARGQPTSGNTSARAPQQRPAAQPRAAPSQQ